MVTNEKKQPDMRLRFILGICLFTSVDTILFGTNSSSIMVLVPRIVAIIGIIFICNFRAIHKKQFFCLSAFLIIALCSFLFNQADLNTSISKLLFIMLGFSIATRFSIRSFFEVFDKVLFIVSCCAIGLEIIAYAVPSVCTHFLKITNEAGTLYYSIGFSSINSIFLNTALIRSSGIYWEAGAFSIYLFLGLLGQLFVFDEINIKKVFIYLSCMVLTFSTTGAIAVSALLLTFIVSKKGSNIKDKKIKFLIILVIIAFAMLFILGEQSAFYNTLFGKITNNASTTRTRIASLVVPFEIAKSSPLIGVSPNKVATSMREFALNSRFDVQASSMCTNTITYQFAAYGVIYGLLFFLRNCYFCKRIACENTFLAIGLMLSISLAYCGENFYSFLPYTFVFLSYCNIENEVC